MNTTGKILYQRFFIESKNVFMQRVAVGCCMQPYLYNAVIDTGSLCDVMIDGLVLSEYSYSVKNGEVVSSDFIFITIEPDKNQYKKKLKIELEFNGINMYKESLILSNE